MRNSCPGFRQRKAASDIRMELPKDECRIIEGHSEAVRPIFVCPENSVLIINKLHIAHDRSLSTGHANSTRDMISRLESMVLSGADLPVEVVRQQISSAIDIFVHLSRLRDRSRRVTEISEVIGMSGGEVKLNPLYRFRESGEAGGRVLGELESCGSFLRRDDKLAMAGIKLWPLQKKSEEAADEGRMEATS